METVLPVPTFLSAKKACSAARLTASAPTTFTLGQVFEIWGQSLASSDIAGLTSMPVRVFVTDNGVATENTGDWSAIELTSRRHITLQVGTPITEIPQYTWIGP